MQSTRSRSLDSGYSDVFVEVQELEKKMYLAYWLFVLLLDLRFDDTRCECCKQTTGVTEHVLGTIVYASEDSLDWLAV